MFYQTKLFKEWKIFKCLITEHFIYLPNLIIIYNSRLVELTEIRRHGYVFRMDYESFLSRYKMLSVHTWPHWTAGGPVDGVTCLLRDLPISANEYSFGRSKIFIRTSKTVRFSKIVPNFCWLVFEFLTQLTFSPVDGVTCLLRDLLISANEYSFGRSKIFIRTSKTVRFSKIVPFFVRSILT